jgi:molybdopterin synthase sulfur carrier subunit
MSSSEVQERSRKTNMVSQNQKGPILKPETLGVKSVHLREDQKMSIEVRIPSPLKSLTGGKDVIQGKGSTVGEVIQGIVSTYPQLQERLCDEKGDVRRFINIFLNEEDIRFLKNLDTPVTEGDSLSIIPAIAGGSGSPSGQDISGRISPLQWAKLVSRG